MQEELDESGPNTVDAMNEEIESLEEQLPGLKESEKKIHGELNSLKAIPLPSELRVGIEKLEEDKESLTARLAKVHGDGSVDVSPKQKEEVRKDWKSSQSESKTRARICRDLWRKCSETLPDGMTREGLWV